MIGLLRRVDAAGGCRRWGPQEAPRLSSCSCTRLPRRREAQPGQRLLGWVAKAADKTSWLNSPGVASQRPALQQEAGNGVFLLLLVNVVAFLADQVLHLPGMGALALHHAAASWWQWVTHMFMHASWAHLANNMFMLLTIGRLVEDTEGAAGVWMAYILCGLGAAFASFALSPRMTVSVGASGAIFGLFSVSVLSRLSSGLSLRRFLESLVLGQFVVRQVLEEVKQQASGGLMVQGLAVSHLAHLGGALAGVLLVLLLHRLPASEPQGRQG